MRYQVSNFNRAFNPFNSMFDIEREFFAPLLKRENVEQIWSPKVDVRERDEHWLLSIDVPGVAREDIKVEVIEDQLVVAGERHFERDEKSYSERSYGRFERRFNLPEGVDAAKIEASYDHGVLNLVVPKVQPVKASTIAIDVKEGKGSLFQKLLGFGKKEETKSIN